MAVAAATATTAAATRARRRARRATGLTGAEGQERRVVAEDLQLELAKRRPRLQPEHLDERLAAAPVGGERVGLPTAAVEGEDELAEQPLTRGMVGDERLELRHERRPLAALELGRDPLLDRRHAELVELPCVRVERGNVAQGVAAPERERLRKLPLLAEVAKANRVDRDA